MEPPTNLRLFLTLFEFTPFDYCPNPFQDFEDAVYGCTTPKKFEENETTCYIINNVGGYFMQLLFFGLVKLVAVIMMMACATEWSKKSTIRKVTKIIDDNLNLQFLAGFIDGTQLDIYMSIYINIYMLNEKSEYLMANFALSLFTFVFYLFLCLTS